MKKLREGEWERGTEMKGGKKMEKLKRGKTMEWGGR